MNTRQTFFNKAVQGKMRLIKKIALPLCLVVITGFAGCASKEYRPNLVYKEWTRTMSQEGIFPVFPPREDVQVGDVWLLPMHPFQTKAVEESGGLGRTGIWYDNIFSNVNGSRTVFDFYASRYAFPKTSALDSFHPKGGKTDTSTANESSESKDAIAKEAVKTFLSGNSSTDLSNGGILDVPSAQNDLFINGDVRRLRQVAFPEFAITNITQAALSALVPIEYFQVAGGLTFNRVKQISLKIPMAESYGIPLKNVYKALRESGIEFDNGTNTVRLVYKEVPAKEAEGKKAEEKAFVNTLILARSQFNEALENISETPGLWFYKGRIKEELKDSKDYIWVALINEVFYARAIDISVTTNQGIGGGARVEPITDNMLKTLKRLDELNKAKVITAKTETTSQSTTTKKNGKQKKKRNKENAEKNNANPDGKNPQGGDAPPPGGEQNTESVAPPDAPPADQKPPVEGQNAEAEPLPETPDANQNPQGGTIVQNIEITQQDDAFSLAQKINSFNTASGQQSTLGGSISVVSVSNTGVGLRRIYDRPIAVGVRGVIMKINVKELNNLSNNGIPITLVQPP